MSMPVEWEYMEKDAGTISNIGKGIKNIGGKIMGNSVVSGVSDIAGGLAGAVAGDTALSKIKENIPGGYQ